MRTDIGRLILCLGELTPDGAYGPKPTSLVAPHMCAFTGKADFRKLTKSLLAALCVDPLHQLEGNPLGTFEESKPPTDVIHLIAQHVHPVGHQVAGHRGDIIDA